MKTKFQSCEIKLDDLDGNTCRGCGMVVCVSCVHEYSHILNGAHGKKRQTRKKAKRAAPAAEEGE